MNSDILKGKWKEIKGDIQRAWGELTDDELERTEGNMTSIAGIIQTKYGVKKEEISHRLTSIFNRSDSVPGTGSEQSARPVSGPLDDVKEMLRKN